MYMRWVFAVTLSSACPPPLSSHNCYVVCYRSGPRCGYVYVRCEEKTKKKKEMFYSRHRSTTTTTTTTREKAYNENGTRRGNRGASCIVGCAVGTGNFFFNIPPCRVHNNRVRTLSRLVPRSRPKPRRRPSLLPAFASSSFWLQQTSRLQITHDDDDDDDRRHHETVTGACVRACVRA